MTSAEFQSAFNIHQHSVYGFAWRMTGSAQIAEDVAQDCFLLLLESPHRFDPQRGTLRVWLLGVARNLILKRWRSEGRWSTLDEEILAAEPLAHDCRLEELVAHAVQSLPPLQREILILIEYEGMTLEEAATAVFVEVGTVKARLHRARNNLRKMLASLRSTS